MKTTTITILFACALLGASCSDSTTEIASAPARESVTPAPPSTPTEEQIRKVAEQRKKKQNAQAQTEAVAPAELAIPAPLTLDASLSRPSVTPTP
jgi:formate dehydrogenase assembly factor FdhD